MRASTPAVQGTEKQSLKIAAAAVVVVVVVGVVKSAACEGALRQAVLA